MSATLSKVCTNVFVCNTSAMQLHHAKTLHLLCNCALMCFYVFLCVSTLQQYEPLRNSRRVWLSLTACVFSCMWSHLCWSLMGVRWSDCVYVFSVALLCHSNAALNRVEAFWDSDLIVPNCIVSTQRCIDDWSIIVFSPIALCYSTIHTLPFFKQYHQTAAQKNLF